MSSSSSAAEDPISPETSPIHSREETDTEAAAEQQQSSPELSDRSGPPSEPHSSPVRHEDVVSPPSSPALSPRRKRIRYIEDDPQVIHNGAIIVFQT